MARPVPIHPTPGLTTREIIDMHIASGALKVTRYEEAHRQRLTPRKHGGQMPSHLDPRQLGLTRAEFEEQQRLAKEPRKATRVRGGFRDPHDARTDDTPLAHYGREIRRFA